MRAKGEVFAPALLALLALAAAGQGQAPATQPSAPPSFSGAAQVLAVEVPVQVMRDGEPVRGLTAEDFEVYEGRRRLAITGFEILDLTVSAGAVAGRATEVPAAARRHFLLLFDLAFSEPQSILRARRSAAGLLAQLHPTDLVAVATYSASRGPQLVLGFTTDRRQLDSALSTLGLPDLIVRPVDPLRLVLQQVLGAENAAGAGVPPLARDPLAEATDVASLQRMETVVNAVDRADRTAQRNHVNNFTRSLSVLARQMAVIDGRKYLVFLSEGFDSALMQGTADSQRQEELREFALHGESWRINPEERYGLTETSNDVERMLEEFRRADCVIQAVDIGGVRAGADQGVPRLGGRDSLLMMARGTGGDLYESFNDLGTAMSRMLKRTSVTYLLAVQPDRLEPAGEYHRLRVELKAPLRGVRLLHRPGYYPPQPFAQQDPIEKLLAAANQMMSGKESDAVATAVLAAPFRSAGEKAYVPVLIEVNGADLLAGLQRPILPVEIYVYALDEFGAVHDFLTQTVGLDLAKTGEPLRQGGLKFFGHLDLLPGDYSLRVLVRNGTSGASGMRVLPLHVPAFAGGEPALLPPLFSEPLNRWLLVREESRGEGRQPAYPFLLRSEPFVPASRPVLAPGRPSRLVLAGFNLGSGPWQAQARVLTLDGREIPGGSLDPLDRRSGGDGADRAVTTFRPPELQPGEYVLRITVTGGTAETSSSLRFVVPPAPRGRG
ncbi:MAG TPA: VWA domain-containing protein [Thermoanaerobaculia bacterium]|jgi:VWFA-related protein|nr:VWA domain-containing protein [Thermoanaerobaculia bacterium]